MANNDIRNEAKKVGVMFWQIADSLNISEATFTRMMRHDLPEEKKQEILSIIENLRKEK